MTQKILPKEQATRDAIAFFGLDLSIGHPFVSMAGAPLDHPSMSVLSPETNYFWDFVGAIFKEIFL